MIFKPLVVDPSSDPPMRQLQGQNELDIPLEEKFQNLRTRFNALIEFLISEGNDLPDETQEL